MLPIDGEPLLAWTLRYLAYQDFKEIAINLHFQSESISNYFGDGAAFGVRLHYSTEERLLGTAGAVKKLAPYFSDAEEFLVLYGDLLLDQDLSAMVQFHRRRKALATLLLHQRPGSNSRVEIDEMGRIVSFIERPSLNERQAVSSPWVNSGVQVLSQRIFDYIPDGRASDFPKDIYVPLASRGQLVGFPLTGYRCAIDSPERYAEACTAFASGQCQQSPSSIFSSSRGPGRR
jgi:mannose-1-phosphate guanylyltransferase/phosphomannomutase